MECDNCIHREVCLFKSDAESNMTDIDTTIIPLVCDLNAKSEIFTITYTVQQHCKHYIPKEVIGD